MYFRRVVIACILATDMSRHDEHVQRLAKRPCTRPPFNRDDDGERLFIMTTLVHACDLGAQTLAPPLAHKWGERVLQEFQAQAQKVRAARPRSAAALAR